MNYSLHALLNATNNRIIIEPPLYIVVHFSNLFFANSDLTLFSC